LSFAANTVMPSKYTCNGGETSPNLQWSISSDAVKGFALIMEDPDAVPIVGYAYVHWNVFGRKAQGVDGEGRGVW
jgi:phosphatidylethanolamine-binding protein (PEBP) family uncharacterized protein